MRVVAADEIDRLLSPEALVEALSLAFRGGMETPLRQHYGIARDGAPATLLLMPAWGGAGEAPGPNYLGVKVVTVYPDNGARQLPSVYGTYLLMDGDTGAPLAAIDGTRLTAWRTAAASALAARHLARADASHLVMVGAGALAPFLIRAHGSQRPIREVTIWNRNRQRAEVLARRLASEGCAATVSDDLEAAVRQADIVSCATLSTEPLVRGDWLKAGAHLDLVGAFTPDMREADDAALQRASVYVDTDAAMTEGGDVAIALASGAIAPAAVKGNLFGLCRGEVAGRRNGEEITAFKSVGTALEDLAGAMLVWRGITEAS